MRMDFYSHTNACKKALEKFLFSLFLGIMCLGVPLFPAWAENRALYGPFTYDIFMRAEDGSWSTCAVALDYDRDLLPNREDADGFDEVVLDAVRSYAIYVDDRIGWPRLAGLGRYVGVLIPHDCQGRHEVGKEIVKLANDQQDYFRVRTVPLANSEIQKRRDISIRIEYGISKEEWRLRQQAMRNPCKPENWTALAEYHSDAHTRSGSNEPISFTAELMFTYASIIAGTSPNDAIEGRFLDPRAQEVVRAMFDYQIPRISC